jgi:hypothetical protein
MTQRDETSEVRRAAKAPFIFGVSGHRDLVAADVPELRAQIEIVFSRYRSLYPNASFELLSPLAEGADRVTAEAALASGIKLRVPMPMAQEEYERDFVAPASLEQFRRLLAAAESHWEILSDGEPDIPGLSKSDPRVARYAVLGDFIARKSHVLILLWDGRDNAKIGGTAWVKKRREYWVKAAKEGGSAPEEFGYVQAVQVVTPRMAAKGAAQERPRVKIIGDLPFA